MYTSALAKTKDKKKSFTLPLEQEGSELLPISALLYPEQLEHNVPLSREHVFFCYKALLHTIDHVLTKTYTAFDAHTTSHCCHGISLLSWNLLSLAQDLDLMGLRSQVERRCSQMKDDSFPVPMDRFPKLLINLGCLYILALLKEPNPEKGGRTVPNRLKTLAPLGSHACRDIANTLQQYFSNWIATSYLSYAQTLDLEMQLHEIPVAIWGKYVQENYIRSNQRGTKYVSNLFSMQIFLASLSANYAKIAIINDLYNQETLAVQGRYVRILQGDGRGGFSPISDVTSSEEPVVVFGGCAYGNLLSQEGIALKMEPWLQEFNRLVLANDLFYPQFFKLRDEPDFDSSPVVPSEKELSDVLAEYADTKGVSVQDPSLFCLRHLYPASLKQVLAEKQQELPLSFIPKTQLPTSFFPA